MNPIRSFLHLAVAGVFSLGATVGGLALASRASAATIEVHSKRSTLAITYREGSSTHVDMRGAGTRANVEGKADVSRKNGRTRVKLHMDSLPHPQSLGSFYTTYLLWAVAPEGQAASLAELPHSKSISVDATTSFQTFGLIVTAEPHSAVALPSPLILAENAGRRDTVGDFQTGNLDYRGAVGTLYSSSGGGRKDFNTPPLVLGARRAVEMAQDAGAEDYARSELDQSERSLETLERAWPRSRSLPKDLQGTAREVMRTAEHARTVAEGKREEARLAAERRTASAKVARAETEADRAREDASAARDRAQREQESAAAARNQAENARAAEERARVAAEQSRFNEEQARLNAERARNLQELAQTDAERARREADDARRDKAEMQQRLYESLSAILETRREARGLIVSLSDVLFDFDRATLTPGAREKLAKLGGILLAYPGNYRLSIEGHTDSIGSHAYNMGLSLGRADSVRSYLRASGLPESRIGQAVGFGKDRPVASNDTAAGRQMNRRVEIVISDLET